MRGKPLLQVRIRHSEAFLVTSDEFEALPPIQRWDILSELMADTTRLLNKAHKDLRVETEALRASPT